MEGEFPFNNFGDLEEQLSFGFLGDLNEEFFPNNSEDFEGDLAFDIFGDFELLTDIKAFKGDFPFVSLDDLEGNFPSDILASLEGDLHVEDVSVCDLSTEVLGDFEKEFGESFEVGLDLSLAFVFLGIFPVKSKDFREGVAFFLDLFTGLAEDPLEGTEVVDFLSEEELFDTVVFVKTHSKSSIRVSFSLTGESMILTGE